MPFHPSDRPKPDLVALARSLAEFEINWVMCGSQVLALHGAELSPNDLDVVPALDPANLERVAACLGALGAVRAYWNGKNGPDDTIENCQTWRPEPPTAAHLDQLFVTCHGMLDIVIANADPFESLLDGATTHDIGGIPVRICDPRRVLKALEGRNRRKDKAREAVYDQMRQRFGPDNLT